MLPLRSFELSLGKSSLSATISQQSQYEQVHNFFILFLQPQQTEATLDAHQIQPTLHTQTVCLASARPIGFLCHFWALQQNECHNP